MKRSASSNRTLYEYDVIVINPESFSHFLFGSKGEFSGHEYELSQLKPSQHISKAERREVWVLVSIGPPKCTGHPLVPPEH